MTQHNIKGSFHSDRQSPHGQRQPSRSRIQPLSAEQLRHLLAATQGDPLNTLFVVAGTTEMRISEMLALKWQDIDLN